MAEHFDALLRGGHVVDPKNGIDQVMDVAVQDGRIARVEPTIRGTATMEHDVSGKVVMPGIVDMHVHLSEWMGGPIGHRMLALAGVTTALDMAGPIEGMVSSTAKHGVGLSVGCISYVRPGHTVGSASPSPGEVEDYLAVALKGGAIGLKLLGGHFPLTQDGSAAVIATCGAHGAYVAFHAGTLETPNPSVATMEEACLLADGNPLHMPHVNSYCRGFEKPGVIEGQEAIEVLARYPAIWSESYLAPFNGFPGSCSNGVPESNAARRVLTAGGYAHTQDGVEQAITDGWIHVQADVGGVVGLVTGADGVAVWKAAGTMVGVSCMVNGPEPRIHLVTARSKDGRFGIDALATDGGGLPRNDIVERGLPLVRMNALTLADFAIKASLTPAHILGLADKGHLAPGADGDITVLDMDRLTPVLTYAGGRRLMEDGTVYPGPSRFFTTPAGRDTIAAAGLDPIVVAPGTMLPARAAA
ncbi:amidohydrolase [Acuticoccus sediminis]|uniref:Amidohydrolase n=1 Tax=Acuticoccus sediminis TaxID=2184697 RepID=A0A8B2NDL6_9HYPH|nr:amidohydrolase family protein [Acuticoccus sediminis]RAH96778.1 amidohydrolase [Acuticoccus sediminis]